MASQFRLRRFIPMANRVSHREILRSGMGAFLGTLATALLGSGLVLQGWLLPALIAPMGASAVLLFAVPSSPLARPWSIVGGNVLSAGIGVTVAMLIQEPSVACAVAIGVAIPAMMALRCLHPPSGAVALTAILGGPAIHDLGYGFVIWPVAGNSIILLSLAIVFNKAIGRHYPHVVQPSPSLHATSDPVALDRVGFSSADLDEVLKEYDQFLDIDRGVLEKIVRRTELRSYRRRGTHTDCGAVMSRDVVAVAPDASLREAHELLRLHHIKALPVTDDNARIVGIVTQTDLLDKALWNNGKPTIGLRRRIALATAGASAPNGTVKDIMTTPVRTVGRQTALADAIVIFAEEGLHYLPVVDDGKKLVGIIAQSDVLVAMLADAAEMSDPPPP